LVPKSGHATLSTSGGVATRRVRYAAHGQRIRVTGRVRPFVAGQIAVLELRKGKRLLGRKRAKIKPARKGGVAVFRVKLRARGKLALRLLHRATPRQKAFRSRLGRVHSGIFRVGVGAKGTSVLVLQRGLLRMGFAVPLSGRYEDSTRRAVTAYQKTNNFSRSGYASPRIYRLVFERRGAFKPRDRSKGRHVEFDWSRQVLALIFNGRAKRVYHASSGTSATPTVFGTFSFYRKEPGTNHLGMVQSNYFIRGYAIHGYPSVPNYPASHGCIRVPIPNATQIDEQIKLGEKIHVYR